MDMGWGYRVSDVVAQDGVADVGGLLLVIELGRVHADEHHRLPRVLLLKPVQLWQDVQTVRTAIRPEVQDHDLVPVRF